ncbi:MAG: hypothetical protein OGM67_07215 [Oscillospiraceae bacterium]|nr:MAG: hypothetical protein OGM67_07215 [Oscillospiraceae bacterium]
MSEQDAALAEQWYSAPDADGVRTLSHDATAAMSELENAFATPDIVLYMAAAKKRRHSRRHGRCSNPHRLRPRCRCDPVCRDVSGPRRTGNAAKPAGRRLCLSR